MNRILEDNRDFNQHLTEKYNKACAVNSFLTHEEKNWIAEHGVIRLGYRDDFLPFCDSDKTLGGLTGALSDYLKFAETAEKNAQLSFETCAYPTMESALNALARDEIDCLFPVNLSSYDGEQRGVIITDPLVSTEMYAAVRTADRQGIYPDRQMTVAVLNGHISHEIFLQDHFPDWQLRYYNTVEECFQSVAAGETDCTLVSNYRINRVSDLCRDNDLSTLTTGETMDLAFAMRQQDDCLYSILNKINRLIPSTLLNASLTNYSFRDEKLSAMDFVRENLGTVLSLSIAIICIILYLLRRSARAEASVKEGKALISEAERDPLIPAMYSRNFFHVYADRFYSEHPGKPMDAIILNIDRFHTINTLNCRAYGDEVLRALGDEIAAFMAESEGVVGRMEGDHFDIYCAHLDDYQALLDDIVAKYGLERRDLNLEVTESAYTENADYLIRMIGKLREMGYVIEMDDFGSGYSSLNMLSSMPIDVLKMDMAFIKNIERNERDFRLVELILDIARYLKVPVVAEGVETGNQLRLLKDAGCDLVQGYYFSRPLPAEEFEQKILDSAT